MEILSKEKDALRKKVSQLEERSEMSPALTPSKSSAATAAANARRSPSCPAPASQQQRRPRLAEKKRIRKLDDEAAADSSDEAAKLGKVTGSELAAVGVSNRRLIG